MISPCDEAVSDEAKQRQCRQERYESTGSNDDQTGVEAFRHWCDAVWWLKVSILAVEHKGSISRIKHAGLELRLWTGVTPRAMMVSLGLPRLSTKGIFLIPLTECHEP